MDMSFGMVAVSAGTGLGYGGISGSLGINNDALGISSMGRGMSYFSEAVHNDSVTRGGVLFGMYSLFSEPFGHGKLVGVVTFGVESTFSGRLGGDTHDDEDDVDAAPSAHGFAPAPMYSGSLGGNNGVGLGFSFNGGTVPGIGNAPAGAAPTFGGGYNPEGIDSMTGKVTIDIDAPTAPGTGGGPGGSGPGSGGVGGPPGGPGGEPGAGGQAP